MKKKQLHSLLERLPYRIHRFLGEGGFGWVYEVEDLQTGQKMALKICKFSAEDKGNLRRRFLREIQITSHLSHPNIMPLYDSGLLGEDFLYYVMKELTGGTLKTLLEERRNRARGARSTGDLIEILIEVCQGVHYAHSKGIIHRDLKPSNIAIGTSGEVMIIDWGIAKALGVEEPTGDGKEEKGSLGRDLRKVTGNLTLNSMLGTPGYMSPEQAQGQLVTPASDVHALGTILYQILTHNLPYLGSPRKKVIQLLTSQPAAPAEKFPELEISPHLSQVAMKCLARDPQDRFQSAAELQKELETYLRS